MHTLHTVSSVDTESSGVTYAVTSLCRALAAQAVNVELLSLGDPKNAIQDGFLDRRFPTELTSVPLLRRLGASRAMRRALFASDAALFHTHGLWMLPNVYPAQAARKLKRPLVLTPHGMLGAKALQFSRLKKRVFWQWTQGPAARAVSCFHATAESEYEDIRAAGLTQSVAVIPTGIDLPVVPPVRPLPASPRVVSLGRIHPIKGLDRLLRAWALIETDYPSWRLEIVGPSEGGHRSVLERLSARIGAAPGQHFRPGVRRRQAASAGASRVVRPVNAQRELRRDRGGKPRVRYACDCHQGRSLGRPRDKRLWLVDRPRAGADGGGAAHSYVSVAGGAPNNGRARQGLDGTRFRLDWHRHAHEPGLSLVGRRWQGSGLCKSGLESA